MISFKPNFSGFHGCVNAMRDIERILLNDTLTAAREAISNKAGRPTYITYRELTYSTLAQESVTE